MIRDAWARLRLAYWQLCLDISRRHLLDAIFCGDRGEERRWAALVTKAQAKVTAWKKRVER